MTNEDFILMLSHQYYKPLYQYAKKICNNKHFAADVVQDTLMIAYQKADELQKHENIAGWLYQTARYRMLHILEENLYYEDLNAMPEYIHGSAGFEDDCITILDLYPEIAKQLNPQDLRLIIRHYEEGYNYNELAEEYHTSSSAIKMKMHRIRRQLQKSLREYFT
ncbi:MAG: sigma-70 family RNA polymerase sigma factor [Lachnospiraceae bacterium]|nr:sigma-70 family RNA polymerase sigma factor [Lachnospiraceae bacterium]